MSPAPHDPPFDEIRGILAIVVSWALAQSLKVLVGLIRDKRFNFRWLVSSGGMPSSHTAAVASLSMVTALYYGFSSMPFWITLVFSLIIMFDAAGVRRAVGRQAGILNKVLDDIYKSGQVREERVKELLGHTPVEVFAGAALGIVVALWFCL